MSYGEGSIREKTRPDGKSYNPKRWQICVSYTVEVVQEDGTTTTERKRIQKTVRGTKTHAKEVLEQIKAAHDDQGREIDEFQQAINATEVAKPKATTLTDMIETWNTARKTAGKASERTIREDRKRLERIEAYLGDKPIGSITAQMVEQTYAAIRKKHGLSGTTMNHLHTLLKNVFQKAVDYDLIPKNPCHFVTAPKREEPKRRSLSQEEGIRLLEEIDKTEMEEYESMGEKEERREQREERGHARDRNALRGIHRVSNIIAVRIGLATGMRRGEVIGLVWKNVDLTRGTIRVCQAATIAGKIKTPKTQAGIRTLAIDTVTAQHLSYWKARQAAELAKIGIVANGETPVCSSDVGTMIRVDNFEHWWAEWRKEHDFVGLKYHELRRGYQDRADAAWPLQPHHHAELVRPRHPGERPRCRADARQHPQPGQRYGNPAGRPKVFQEVFWEVFHLQARGGRFLNVFQMSSKRQFKAKKKAGQRTQIG